MRRHVNVLLASCLLFALLPVIGCTLMNAATSSPSAAAEPFALESDLDMLLGPTWRGTLTYLDYTTKEITTIPSTLSVEKRAATAQGPQWSMAVGYTEEPQQNSAELLTLSDGGRMFGAEHVVERTLLAGGSVRLVTEEAGEDNGTPALVRRIYVLGPTTCSIHKLVRPDGTPDFFERNAYNWTR